MPAKDYHHNTVVHSLKKAGWSIVAEQVALILLERRLWIDIQARKEAQTILVEVKGFDNPNSLVEYLANSVGQYVMYQSIVEYLGKNIPLYMAVPVYAYFGILNEEIGQIIAPKVGLKLIAFNPVEEEIVQWKH